MAKAEGSGYCHYSSFFSKFRGQTMDKLWTNYGQMDKLFMKNFSKRAENRKNGQIFVHEKKFGHEFVHKIFA